MPAPFGSCGLVYDRAGTAIGTNFPKEGIDTDCFLVIDFVYVCMFCLETSIHETQNVYSIEDQRTTDKQNKKKKMESHNMQSHP